MIMPDYISLIHKYFTEKLILSTVLIVEIVPLSKLNGLPTKFLFSFLSFFNLNKLTLHLKKHFYQI